MRPHFDPNPSISSQFNNLIGAYKEKILKIIKKLWDEFLKW